MKTLQIMPVTEYFEKYPNIYPSSKMIPEWYKKSKSVKEGSKTFLFATDNGFGSNSTYKRCMPFFDALTAGYMIVLPCDVEVSINDAGFQEFMWESNFDIISTHEDWQKDLLPVPDGYNPIVFKFNNRLEILTSKNHSILFTSPLNRFDLPFITMDGIVDTDTFDICVNFPFFIKNDFNGILKKGTPIIQLIPFERQKWERKYIKFNPKEAHTKFMNYKSNIVRSYKNFFWHKKEYK